MGDKTACYCWELVRSNMSPPTFRDTRNNVTTSDNAREGGWISRLIGKYISPSDIERMMNRAQCNSSINEIEIIASVLEKLEKIDLKIKTEDSVSEIMRYMIGVLIRAHDPSKENSKKEILKLLAKSNIFNQLLEKVEKSLNLIKECMDNVDDTAFEKFRRDDDVKVDTGRVAINNSIEFIGNYKSRRLLYEKESKKDMDDFENILKERGLTLEDARDTHNECFKGQY
ncbi:MAG: hypothetical protein LBC92_04505, partial [Rickettsiales bacterium]|nr:hypothetical protein [Rickettsiales bacterium]